MSEKTIQAHLVALEEERCRCMVNADLSRLSELLHPDLIHVHAKAQVDDFESYFNSGGFKVDYRCVDRSDLRVRLVGDNCALMTGRQNLEAVRKDGSGTVYIDSQVLQVWVKENGHWQQLAFQTTPLTMRVDSAS